MKHRSVNNPGLDESRNMTYQAVYVQCFIFIRIAWTSWPVLEAVFVRKLIKVFLTGLVRSKYSYNRVNFYKIIFIFLANKPITSWCTKTKILEISVFFYLHAQMTPVGHWYACACGRLEILWRHKLVNKGTRAHFSRVSFGAILWKFVYFMI